LQFKLQEPWTEWLIPTIIGRIVWYSKLDTGSSVTLIGKKVADQFGLSTDFIISQPCIKFLGVFDKTQGYAFKVPCGFLPLGDNKLPISKIFVPFEFTHEESTYRFTTTDKYLIGTDVLNNYNCTIIFTGGLTGKVVKSTVLKLDPHGLLIPDVHQKEYTIEQLAKEASLDKKFKSIWKTEETQIK